MKKDNNCYGPLDADSLKRAQEEYDNSFSVDLLNGRLRCECGARVGAIRPESGKFKPTLHLPYKERRKPDNPSGKGNFKK